MQQKIIMQIKHRLVSWDRHQRQLQKQGYVEEFIRK